MAQRKTVSVENTAQAYLELLRAMGVKYFFGNAGTDFASLIDSFAKFAAEGKRTPYACASPTRVLCGQHGAWLSSGHW